MDAGEHVGLVGRNGAGKSTLCRILAGSEEGDQGEVIRRKGLRLAYLEQEPVLDPEQSAREVVLTGLGLWQEAVDRHRMLCNRLEGAEAAGLKEEELGRLLTEQAEAAHLVEDCGGWDLDHQADMVLGHLGISAVEQKVGSMSGGERRRVALARLLVSGPELAIIDEPTNHLDIPTIEWLEEWFKDKFKGALLLVTHDRYLLDRVTTRTVEVEGGKLHSYQGGWEAFLAGKAERTAIAERTESNRQNFLRKELEWLRRQPKARTVKSKARVDRVEGVLAIKKIAQEKNATIQMDAVRSGRTVLEADDLCINIGDRCLVDRLTLRVSKGQRIGILGPNGCGKTTLLKVLMGENEPSQGKVVRARDIRVAYLDQGRSQLRDEKTVSEEVGGGRAVINLGGQELSIAAYLERFLFDRQEQQKLIGKLSGGERARVGIAQILSDASQMVVLDEPTNDLDVSTLGALEDALLEFSGVALIVTHDRRFLDRVATDILAFEAQGKLSLHAGNYADYQARMRSQKKSEESGGRGKERAKQVAPKNTPERGNQLKKGLSYAEGVELKKIMAKIEKADEKQSALEEELSSPSFYERSRAAQKEFLGDLARAKKTAESLMARWETLEARREDK